jgi:hypothetical protein
MKLKQKLSGALFHGLILTNIQLIYSQYLSLSQHMLKTLQQYPTKTIQLDILELKIEEFSSDRITLIHSLVDKLIDLRSRISRVHIVLLPELALTKSEYDYLLLLLFKYRKEIKYLPMVIAGVMSDDYSDEENPHAVYNNEVKIASYFAGRWYDLNQRKHHRWRLDKNQLIQYSLATKLATHRKWFEYISTSQRKLTVLSTNSWLSLVALICEDLARLEPVSESDPRYRSNIDACFA